MVLFLERDTSEERSRMATIEKFWEENDSEVDDSKRTQGSRFYTTDQGTLTEPLPRMQSQFNMEEKFIFPVQKAESGAFSFISVGRVANNDIVLTGGGVSKMHAVFQKADSGYTLMDFGSRNGTFINGIKLEAQKPELLRDRDLISFSSQVSARFFLSRTLYIWFKGQPFPP